MPGAALKRIRHNCFINRLQIKKVDFITSVFAEMSPVDVHNTFGFGLGFGTLKCSAYNGLSDRHHPQVAAMKLLLVYGFSALLWWGSARVVF